MAGAVFLTGRSGPLGPSSILSAVLDDHRCAEMSSAMPTGGYRCPTALISSTLAWRRPNSGGAAAVSRGIGRSTHTWQQAQSTNGAASAGRDAPAAKPPRWRRPLHGAAANTMRAPYARRRDRERPPTRPREPPPPRRRAGERPRELAQLDARVALPRERSPARLEPGHVPQGCGRDRS